MALNVYSKRGAPLFLHETTDTDTHSVANFSDVQEIIFQDVALTWISTGTPPQSLPFDFTGVRRTNVVKASGALPMTNPVRAVDGTYFTLENGYYIFHLTLPYTSANIWSNIEVGVKVWPGGGSGGAWGPEITRAKLNVIPDSLLTPGAGWLTATLPFYISEDEINVFLYARVDSGATGTFQYNAGTSNAYIYRFYNTIETA